MARAAERTVHSFHLQFPNLKDATGLKTYICHSLAFCCW